MTANSTGYLVTAFSDEWWQANATTQTPRPKLDGDEHFISLNNGYEVFLYVQVTDSRTGNSTSDQALAASVSDAGWTANAATQPPQPQLDGATHEYFTSLDNGEVGRV